MQAALREFLIIILLLILLRGVMCVVNKLWTRIRGRNGLLRYDVRSSLKELRWTRTVARLNSNVSRMIPGNWGKAESGWLTQPLLKSDRKVETAEA